MPATRTKNPEPPPAALWSDREREAWTVPPPRRPSQWAEARRQLYRSSIPGPWRNDNAPYARGLMDIPTRPGCVRASCQKGARIGWSEILRNLIGYWAEDDPLPVGLVLPSRDEGRKMVKSDVLPLFRRTPALRNLIGRGRDALAETIDLINGFHLGLMWSGSAASTAGKLYARGIIDEADKTEDWAGDEPDLIGRIESRISTYGDRRLMLVGSTPTTISGKIHQQILQSSFILYFHVPCPQCGKFQRLVWTQFKWAKPADVERWLAAARQAAAAGRLEYEDKITAEGGCATQGHIERFADPDHLAARIAWLADCQQRMGAAVTKSQMADVLAWGREHLVWYQCDHCPGRIFDQDKASAIRRGRWTTEAGVVVDYWGTIHEDAEAVERWPNETRIGFQIPSWYSLMIHWATIVAEFLRADGDLAATVNWRTERAGEPYEHAARRLLGNVFSGKCERATLPAEIVPAWASVLLATFDTQQDHFYGVVRAWGGSFKSQRVWHGKLLSFDQIDRLLFATHWPVDGGEFPPMTVSRALIDSGGTADLWLDQSRTQQVYDYVIPRQAVLAAIKGTSRPGAFGGLYWRMKNPMGGAGSSGKNALPSELAAWMIDSGRCKDLLSDLILQGLPRKDGQPPREPERWLLNKLADPEYDAQMGAMHKVPDKPGRHMVEAWRPVHSGARHDYHDCETYQIALAYMTYVHLLPGEAEVIAGKREELVQLSKTSGRERTAAGDAAGDWTVRPL